MEFCFVSSKFRHQKTRGSNKQRLLRSNLNYWNNPTFCLFFCQNSQDWSSRHPRSSWTCCSQAGSLLASGCPSLSPESRAQMWSVEEGKLLKWVKATPATLSRTTIQLNSLVMLVKNEGTKNIIICDEV